MYLAWNPARPDILAAVSQESEITFVDARSQKVLATLPSVKEVLPIPALFRPWNSNPEEY